MKAIQLITFVSLFFTLLIFSCGKKDDPAPSGGGTGGGGNNSAPCVTDNTLSLRIVNNSPNEYDVSYGVSGRILVEGNTSRTVNAPAGSQSVRAIQKSGVAPGTTTADLTLNYSGAACETSSVTINPECATVGLLNLTVNNTSNNSYQVRVGSQNVTIDRNSSKVVLVPSGFGSVRVTQNSGINFDYGTVTYDLSYSGTACGTASVTIVPECKHGSFGIVRLVNNSSNPYTITYNGNNSLGEMAGGSSKDFYFSYGTVTIKARQKSGFQFFPTERERTFNISECSNATFTFP